MKYLSIWGAITLTLLILLSSCEVNIQPGGGANQPGATATTGHTAQEPQWGVQSKTSGCQANGPNQDTACTPGAIFPDATKEKVCKSGYAGSVRNVTTSLKNKVYAAYGVKTRKPGQYEVDHLVSLELGGSNDISNLWPELAEPRPGFHEKDKVENYLHDQVCSGAISLKDAQIKIATDWVSVYNSMPNKSGGESGSDENS